MTAITATAITTDWPNTRIGDVNRVASIADADFDKLPWPTQQYVRAQAESGGMWERDAVYARWRNKAAPDFPALAPPGALLHLLGLAPLKIETPPQFEAWWAIYPNNPASDRLAALHAWRVAVARGADPDAIRNRLEVEIATATSSAIGWRRAATWIRRRYAVGAFESVGETADRADEKSWAGPCILRRGPPAAEISFGSGGESRGRFTSLTHVFADDAGLHVTGVDQGGLVRTETVPMTTLAAAARDFCGTVRNDPAARAAYHTMRHSPCDAPRGTLHQAGWCRLCDAQRHLRDHEAGEAPDHFIATGDAVARRAANAAWGAESAERNRVTLRDLATDRGIEAMRTAPSFWSAAA